MSYKWVSRETSMFGSVWDWWPVAITVRLLVCAAVFLGVWLLG